MYNKPHGEPGGPDFVGNAVPHLTRPHIPWIVRVLAGAILLLVLVGTLAVSAIVYVAPNEYGIKEVKVGVDRGIHTKIYSPGCWFLKPFGMERMHRFPRHVQVFELTSTESTSLKSPSHAFDKAAKIQTSDGFFVDVDITILYRITDPYKLMTTLGPGILYLTSGIQPKAEPVLKQALGELDIEDFYNSVKRVEKADKAKEALNEAVSPKGLTVDQILVRYFKYSDEIQKSIEAKKLQDQLVFKNQAEAKANTEEAATKKTKMEGEMLVKVALEEGNAYKIEKAADTELYTRKKVAEGELLVKSAEAEATQLKNEAMQLAGNDRKVALEMAKLLEGLECLVVPTGGEHGVNPLDLSSMMNLFGVQPDAPKEGRPPLAPAAAVPIPSPPPPPAAPAASTIPTQKENSQ